MSIDFSRFFETLRQTSLQKWSENLEQATLSKLKDANHGDFSAWKNILEEFPKIKPTSIGIDQAIIQIGKSGDLPKVEENRFRESLLKLHPWRKGPFELFGIFIDTEWKSHLKWERVSRVIQPLRGKMILDLGCGNGYYLWRMLGAGAKLALGVDPSLHFLIQFQVLQKYLKNSHAAVLPLGVEELPQDLTGFDTVFSMGLLYHRRDPIEHLERIRNFLSEEGEVVLETLVIDGKEGEVLKPQDRYAKMRNVWNIPTCATLELWLKKAGFQKVECADVSLTTPQEQRKTDWMWFESLEDFLDPKDHSKTVEGYPAPKRAIFTARKKK